MTEFQYMDEGNSEAQDRLATSFLLAQSSPGLARTGVLSGLGVTQTTTASGSVLIAAGAAAVQASVGTGVSLLVNDTLKTLDVFTANPMGGLPRNDIVAFDMVTKVTAVIVGTPNATPDDPTVPATACAQGRLRHAASATTIPTAKIDDLRVYTSLAGTTPRIGRQKLTSDSGTVVTENAVLVCTATTRSGGIRMTVNGQIAGTVAGDQIAVRVRDGSVAGQQLSAAIYLIGANLGAAVSITDYAAVSVGAHSLYVTLERLTGTGTVKAAANFLAIIDEDPA